MTRADDNTTDSLARISESMRLEFRVYVSGDKSSKTDRDMR